MPNVSLSRDFNMYYSGTYVCKEVGKELQVMYVEEIVPRSQRDYSPELVGLIGRVYKDGGRTEEREEWTGADIFPFTPMSGYYKLGSRVHYLTYNAENRTQKKGFVPGRVLLDGTRPDFNLGFANIYTLFNQVTFPGLYGRDLCVSKGKLMWKGNTIGTFHDGEVTINKDYSHVKELVCKLLGRYLEVSRVTVEQ